MDPMAIGPPTNNIHLRWTNLREAIDLCCRPGTRPRPVDVKQIHGFEMYRQVAS